jgi:hypothetical protein
MTNKSFDYKGVQVEIAYFETECFYWEAIQWGRRLCDNSKQSGCRSIEEAEVEAMQEIDAFLGA